MSLQIVSNNIKKMIIRGMKYHRKKENRKKKQKKNRRNKAPGTEKKNQTYLW